MNKVMRQADSTRRPLCAGELKVSASSMCGRQSVCECVSVAVHCALSECISQDDLPTERCVPV